MAKIKLVTGEVYVAHDIFFERNKEVEVSAEVAEELLKEEIKDFDQDTRTFKVTKYFEAVAEKAPAKSKAKEVE